MAEVGEVLGRIEGNLGSVDAGVVGAAAVEGIEVLGTMSEVKLNDGLGKIEIVRYDGTRLGQEREQERREMNAIMELNYRIVNNLNEKIKEAYAAKIKNSKKV